MSSDLNAGPSSIDKNYCPINAEVLFRESNSYSLSNLRSVSHPPLSSRIPQKSRTSQADPQKDELNYLHMVSVVLYSKFSLFSHANLLNRFKGGARRGG